MKQVISEQAAYTMARMMQGPVDFGTAAGMRVRLGAAEMGGKTGTTNNNTDAWFLGYTPQLLAGTWIGCDNNFIRLGGTLGQGGKAARPIWEYFFEKVYEDKTLGIDRNARFAQPENMNNAPMMDWESMNKNPSPGAQGSNEGNGDASGYNTPLDFNKDTSHVPVESTLSPEERKILNEANKSSRKDEERQPEKQPAQPEKKKGFFKRLFGPKN